MSPTLSEQWSAEAEVKRAQKAAEARQAHKLNINVKQLAAHQRLAKSKEEYAELEDRGLHNLTPAELNQWQRLQTDITITEERLPFTGKTDEELLASLEDADLKAEQLMYDYKSINDSGRPLLAQKKLDERSAVLAAAVTAKEELILRKTELEVADANEARARRMAEAFLKASDDEVLANLVSIGAAEYEIAKAKAEALKPLDERGSEARALLAQTREEVQAEHEETTYRMLTGTRDTPEPEPSEEPEVDAATAAAAAVSNLADPPAHASAPDAAPGPARVPTPPDDPFVE